MILIWDLAEDGRNLTDHVRLVDVRYQEQIAFRREVDAVFVDLDDLGSVPLNKTRRWRVPLYWCGPGR